MAVSLLEIPGSPTYTTPTRGYAASNLRGPLLNIRSGGDHSTGFGPVVTISSQRRSTAIVVQPTADDAELLASLGMKPADCRSVDAYWMFGDSVCWTEFHAGAVSDVAAGIYYRFDEEHRRDAFVIDLGPLFVESGDLRRVFELLEGPVERGVVGGVVAGARSAYQCGAALLTTLPGTLADQ
jgi:hypothetical protein